MGMGGEGVVGLRSGGKNELSGLFIFFGDGYRPLHRGGGGCNECLVHIKLCNVYSPLDTFFFKYFCLGLD